MNFGSELDLKKAQNDVSKCLTPKTIELDVAVSGFRSRQSLQQQLASQFVLLDLDIAWSF